MSKRAACFSTECMIGENLLRSHSCEHFENATVDFLESAATWTLNFLVLRILHKPTALLNSIGSFLCD